MLRRIRADLCVLWQGSDILEEARKEATMPATVNGARRLESARIELLYFDGCPTYLEAERGLREVLAEKGVEVEISLAAVNTDEEARELRFPGSPTIRVDGRNLFPVPDRSTWALGCRVYPTPEGPRGAPTPEMLRAALGRDGEGREREEVVG